jgi:hypothetical protein
MPKIRISKKDRQEYNRLKNNARGKMRRLAKKGIDQETINGLIELPPLLSFESRHQFNEWKEEIKRFTNRNVKDFKVFTNEKNVPLLGKEIREYKEVEAKAIKLAMEHYEHTTPEAQKIFLKPNNLDIPRPLDLDNVETRKRFKQKFERMKERSDEKFFNKRDAQFLENFIKSVEGSFNQNALVIKVVNQLRKIPPDYFYELYKDYFEYFNFELYDSEGQYVDADLNQIMAISHILNEYEAGRLDFPLKNFPDKI